jgi:protein-S-isoprenylcysteine O-methyltransferase Ste14
MAGAFVAALCSAVASAQLGSTQWWVLKPVWALGNGEPPVVTLFLTGLGCLLAFIIRTWGESHLGAAVYGQGETAGLMDQGPFGRVRNPLYLGTWLFFFSTTALWAPALLWLLMSALFAATLHAMVLHEETLLTQSLGAPYVDYLKRVPRWLPRVSSDARVLVATRHGPAVLGNVGLLSLGLFRLAWALGLPLAIPSLLNGLGMLLWLGVIVWRRWRR